MAPEHVHNRRGIFRAAIRQPYYHKSRRRSRAYGTCETGGRQHRREKYWGYYGFTEHIEWCAAFVSWIYGQAGKSEPLFFGCESGGAQWFKERDQWGDSDYEDIAPGDSIFFDWDLNGTADHVGLVVGTDGDNVYTIEGNRDDVCIAKSYSRSGYQWILGYGLMEW